LGSFERNPVIDRGKQEVYETYMEDFKSLAVESAATEKGEKSKVERVKKGLIARIEVFVMKAGIKAVLPVIAIVLLLSTAGIGAYFYMDYADQWVSTNNAAVDGKIYAVITEVSGRVEKIHEVENARVIKSEPIVDIDYTHQSISIRKIKAAIRANALAIAELIKQPHAVSELEIARARRDELNLLLEEAEFLYRQTRILSPAYGYVAQMQVEAGEYVMPGQTLMYVVDLDNLWITANFSEEQVRYLRVGQVVDIYVDAYPDNALKGKVARIMPAGGSAFALFPPDATAGNWVRVSQRIPVRIEFEMNRNGGDLPLRIGMLARVRVER